MPRDAHLLLTQEARDYLVTLPTRDRSRLVSDLLMMHKKYQLVDMQAVKQRVEKAETEMAVLQERLASIEGV